MKSLGGWYMINTVNKKESFKIKKGCVGPILCKIDTNINEFEEHIEITIIIFSVTQFP